MKKKVLGEVLAETYSDHGKEMGRVVADFRRSEMLSSTLWAIVAGLVLIIVAVAIFVSMPTHVFELSWVNAAFAIFGVIGILAQFVAAGFYSEYRQM